MRRYSHCAMTAEPDQMIFQLCFQAIKERTHGPGSSSRPCPSSSHDNLYKADCEFRVLHSNSPASSRHMIERYIETVY